MMKNMGPLTSWRLLVLATSTILGAAAAATGESISCEKPEVSASAYITEDATVLTHVAFTTQFALKCSNAAVSSDVKGISLYAEIEGKSFPAVRLGSQSNKYQVSWTYEVKRTHAGDYNVNLYDESSYGALGRARRNDQDTSNIKPLAVVIVNNPGVFLGPWVNSELLATLVAGLILYYAFLAKSKLLA